MADEPATSDPTTAPRRTLGRFLLVGCANASIDAGVYLALRAIGLELLVANVISTTCGLIFSFFANRSFTFGVRSSSARTTIWQAVSFFVVVGIGLWIIQPAVIAVAGWLLGQWLDLPQWASDLVAKAAAIGVALVWNYALFHLVVFRKGREPSLATPRT